MGRRMRAFNTSWSPHFAYVIGVITADGNLSPSGRHISITSKDEELLKICKSVLGLDNKIGKKSRGGTSEKKYFVLQFGSVVFYNFLLDIGLTPNKSRHIGEIIVPKKYFADFLRGLVDGDGSISCYAHPESIYPQLRLTIASGSNTFVQWVHKTINSQTTVQGGWIYTDKRKNLYILTFGKQDAVRLGKFMYNDNSIGCRLTRKYERMSKYL